MLGRAGLSSHGDPGQTTGAFVLARMRLARFFPLGQSLMPPGVTNRQTGCLRLAVAAVGSVCARHDTDGREDGAWRGEVVGRAVPRCVVKEASWRGLEREG